MLRKVVIRTYGSGSDPDIWIEEAYGRWGIDHRVWITVYVKVWIAGMDRGMDRFEEPVYDPYYIILACHHLQSIGWFEDPTAVQTRTRIPGLALVCRLACWLKCLGMSPS